VLEYVMNPVITIRSKTTLFTPSKIIRRMLLILILIYHHVTNTTYRFNTLGLGLFS
jgi:hypothetical protein